MWEVECVHTGLEKCYLCVRVWAGLFCPRVGSRCEHGGQVNDQSGRRNSLVPQGLCPLELETLREINLN